MSDANNEKDFFTSDPLNFVDAAVSMVKGNTSIEEMEKNIEEHNQSLATLSKIRSKMDKLTIPSEKKLVARIISENLLTFDQLLYWLEVGLPIDCLKETYEVCSTGKFEELLPYLNKFKKKGKLARMEVIIKAHNFSKEQLDFITSANFDCYQMDEIRIGIVHGLSMEKIKIYANPKYHYAVMYVLRKALESNFTQEQIDLLLSINGNTIRDVPELMENFRYAMANYGLSLDKAKKMIALIKSVPFSYNDIDEMFKQICGQIPPGYTVPIGVGRRLFAE